MEGTNTFAFAPFKLAFFFIGRISIIDGYEKKFKELTNIG
jgi:hypothetical protein